MTVASNRKSGGFQYRQGGFLLGLGLGAFQVVLLTNLPGCMTPQPTGAKIKDSKKDALPTQPVTGSSEKEKAGPQKEESLAAVEEFLSRNADHWAR